jgi:iron complex outermembrane recepter protein
MMSKKTFCKTPLAAAIGGILAGASPLAVAQNADADGAILEEIVVTATRREQSILDVPYNITAVSGDALEDAIIIDNTELMREIAGASVVDRGRRNSGVINSIMIRGLNIDGSALGDYALNTVPSVSTYINDTPIYANFILKDVERVEVLRGPQGTLYGSGSLGGTVRYITRAPNPEQFEGQISGSISQTEGSEGENYSIDVVLNAPLSDSAAFRLSAGTLQNDGIVDYVNVYELDSDGTPVAPNGVLDPTASFRYVEDADDVDVTYARAAFSFEPNDKFNLTFSYHMQRDEIGGRRQQTSGTNAAGESYGEYQIGSIQLEPSSRDVDLASLEAEIDLGFATLTSSTSVYEHNGDSTSENTGFYAQIGWLEFYYYNYPRPMASAVRTYSDEAFVQELRLVSNGDNAVDWVAGIFYRDQDLLSTQESFLRGFEAWYDVWAGDPSFVVRDKDFDYSRNENFTDLGVFAEATWHVSDTFRLTGGLRYFDVDFENTTYMGVGLWAPGIFFFEDTASFSQSEDDVLYKVNASWDLSDDAMLYGTISEGYRRGGSNAVPLIGVFAEDPGWLQYSSDSVTNYEVGIKGSTGRLRYSAAVFFVDWQDVQVNTASSNWAFFTAANGDEAETKGVEIELNGYLSDQVRYSLGYAYVDGELTKDALAPTASAGVIAPAGATLPGTAENTFNASLDYTHELNSGMSWMSRVSAYYQSDTENSIGDAGRSPGTFTTTLDSFTLWNFVTTISSNNWDASLFVKNLTDEEGVTGLFTEPYMGSAPQTSYIGNGAKEFLALPRTIGVHFTWHF